MHVLESLVWFYLSAIFIGMGIMGVAQYRRAEKENHPFVDFNFSVLLVILPICFICAVGFAFIGYKIITQ